MHWTVKGFFAFVLCWIVVVNAFVMATRSAEVLDQAERDEFDMPWQFEAPLWIGAIVGVMADAAFNLSAGTWIFSEAPKYPGEVLFTARANRHLASEGERGEKALKWCLIMDRFDPGHCSDLVFYLKPVSGSSASPDEPLSDPEIPVTE